MKKIGILVVLLGLCTPAVLAQQRPPRSYFEFNFGGAVLEDGEGSFVFPGLSVLIGQQVFLSPKFFAEYQFGLALPTIGTAKLGIGAQSGNFGVSAGLRVVPNTVYLQCSRTTRGGQWNASLEHAPFFRSNPEWSFYSTQIFTVGHQWNLGRKPK